MSKQTPAALALTLLLYSLACGGPRSEVTETDLNRVLEFFQKARYSFKYSSSDVHIFNEACRNFALEPGSVRKLLQQKHPDIDKKLFPSDY